MVDQTGGWLETEDWPSTLDEIRRFLDTWCFSLSEDGFVHVQPQTDRISTADLRGFLRRLDLVCDDAYPRIVVFDFSKPTFEPGDWNDCEALIRAFANRINAVPMFERNPDTVGVAVLVRRAWLRRVYARPARRSRRNNEKLAS